MKTIQLTISINEKYQEALIAELEEMEFEGYQQFDDELIAFISQKNFHIGDRERIERLLAVYPGKNFIQAEKPVEERNWNSEWEQTIQSQEIGSFLVKPTWVNRKPEEGQILLEIDPKMAFGTGCHATTRLMLKMVPEYIKPQSKVLDAGTGTGILAIAAAKSGAEKIIAFDMDERSVQNASENILLNEEVDKVEIRQGSIETICKADSLGRRSLGAGGLPDFDVILANINKNTIFEMLPAFSKMLTEEGTLLLSGILKQDEPEVKHHLKQNELKFVKAKQEKEWLVVCASK